MFELLSLRKGTTLTKEMFLNHLYGGMDEPELKIIDVFICKLRKKLAEATGGENYIETVWGRGYVLRRIMRRATSWLMRNAVRTFCCQSVSTPSSSGLRGSEGTTWRQALIRMSTWSKASSVAESRFACASFCRMSPAK